MRGSLAFDQISSIHDQTSSKATAGHCPSRCGYASGCTPRRASARSSPRAATFNGETCSHRSPITHEAIPSPTQKSTQVRTVIGFSKNSSACALVAKSPPTRPTSKSSESTTVATTPSRRRSTNGYRLRPRRS